MSVNPFGPQSGNAVTVLPSGTTVQRYADSTWFQDCDASGNNATPLTAAFLNNIVGNLGVVIANAKLTSQAIGDMTVLYRAIVAIAAANVTGTEVTDLAGNVIGKVS